MLQYPFAFSLGIGSLALAFGAVTFPSQKNRILALHQTCEVLKTSQVSLHINPALNWTNRILSRAKSLKNQGRNTR
ncbi:MAG: hypothetical protein B6245_22605 [Desulfobacteraceae bacterium 4572_88]|nr:MAG: hypothetical protein B6245_22605 [Desulfobacteraceae bacterium 4572_88]